MMNGRKEEKSAVSPRVKISPLRLRHKIGWIYGIGAATKELYAVLRLKTKELDYGKD